MTKRFVLDSSVFCDNRFCDYDFRVGPRVNKRRGMIDYAVCILRKRSRQLHLYVKL